RGRRKLKARREQREGEEQQEDYLERSSHRVRFRSEGEAELQDQLVNRRQAATPRAVVLELERGVVADVVAQAERRAVAAAGVGEEREAVRHVQMLVTKIWARAPEAPRELR